MRNLTYCLFEVVSQEESELSRSCRPLSSTFSHVRAPSTSYSTTGRKRCIAQCHWLRDLSIKHSGSASCALVTVLKGKRLSSRFRHINRNCETNKNRFCGTYWILYFIQNEKWIRQQTSIARRTKNITALFVRASRAGMTCLYALTYAEASVGIWAIQWRGFGSWIENCSVCRIVSWPTTSRRVAVDDRGGQRREGNTMNDVKKERCATADGVREPGELQMAPTVNHNRHDSGTGDELVSSVTLYRRRPRLLHGTVLPFLAVLYPGWMYAWLGVYGAAEYPEAGLLALAAIGIAHVLTALSGYWSVHAHCWLTCSKVNISKAGKKK